MFSHLLCAFWVAQARKVVATTWLPVSLMWCPFHTIFRRIQIILTSPNRLEILHAFQHFSSISPTASIAHHSITLPFSTSFLSNLTISPERSRATYLNDPIDSFWLFYTDWAIQALACVLYYTVVRFTVIFYIGMCMYVDGMVADLHTRLSEIDLPGPSRQSDVRQNLISEITFHSEILSWVHHSRNKLLGLISVSYFMGEIWFFMHYFFRDSQNNQKYWHGLERISVLSTAIVCGEHGRLSICHQIESDVWRNIFRIDTRHSRRIVSNICLLLFIGECHAESMYHRWCILWLCLVSIAGCASEITHSANWASTMCLSSQGIYYCRMLARGFLVGKLIRNRETVYLILLLIFCQRSNCTLISCLIAIGFFIFKIMRAAWSYFLMLNKS